MAIQLGCLQIKELTAADLSQPNYKQSVIIHFPGMKKASVELFQISILKAATQQVCMFTDSMSNKNVIISGFEKF